jgi:hypothetical protein
MPGWNVLTTGFDEKGQQYFMITNATGMQSLTVLELNSRTARSFSLSSACQGPIFLTNKLFYSSATKMIYTLAWTAGKSSTRF